MNNETFDENTLRAITEGYYVTVVDAEDFDRYAADRDPEP